MLEQLVLFTLLLPQEGAAGVVAECRCAVPSLPDWTAVVIGGWRWAVHSAGLSAMLALPRACSLAGL